MRQSPQKIQKYPLIHHQKLLHCHLTGLSSASTIPLCRCHSGPFYSQIQTLEYCSASRESTGFWCVPGHHLHHSPPKLHSQAPLILSPSPRRNQYVPEKIVIPLSLSNVKLSRKAFFLSTLPRFLVAPQLYNNASERVVFPASTWASIPITIFFIFHSAKNYIVALWKVFFPFLIFTPSLSISSVTTKSIPDTFSSLTNAPP